MQQHLIRSWPTVTFACETAAVTKTHFCQLFHLVSGRVQLTGVHHQCHCNQCSPGLISTLLLGEIFLLGPDNIDHGFEVKLFSHFWGTSKSKALDLELIPSWSHFWTCSVTFCPDGWHSSVTLKDRLMYEIMLVTLGKPSRANCAVFLNIFQTGGGGSNPCWKILLQIFYYSKGLFGNIKRKTFKGKNVSNWG